MKANRAVIRNIPVAAITIIAGLLLLAAQESHSQDGDRLYALAAHDKYPTFSLTLRPGLRDEVISEYHVGDEMWLTVVMTNLTNHEIDYSSEDAGGYDLLFSYEATDEDGKPVKRNSRSTMGRNHGGGIGPGGSVPDEILISRVFKLNQPGKYTIRVSRREPFVEDEKGERPVVWSNYVTITVLPADSASDSAPDTQ